MTGGSEPETPPRRRLWRRVLGSRWLRYGGTLLVGGYLLVQADLSGVWRTIGRARPGWILLAVALYVVDRGVAAHKWRILFEARGRTLPFGRALVVYLKASFLGAPLPSTVGVDTVRSGMVREEAGSLGYAVGSVAAERFLGLAALAACALSGIVLFGSRSGWMTFGRPVLVGSAVAGVALAALVLVPDLRGALGRESGRGSGRLARALGFLEDVRSQFRGYAGEPGAVARAFGWSLGQHYLFIGINWVLAVSLGLAVPATEMLWIWPLVMVAVRLPVSVLGFGVREAVIFQFFSEGGLSLEASVSLGLLSGGLDLLFVGVGGLLVATGGGAPPRPGRDGARDRAP